MVDSSLVRCSHSQGRLPSVVEGMEGNLSSIGLVAFFQAAMCSLFSALVSFQLVSGFI